MIGSGFGGEEVNSRVLEVEVLGHRSFLPATVSLTYYSLSCPWLGDASGKGLGDQPMVTWNVKLYV